MPDRGAGTRERMQASLKCSAPDTDDRPNGLERGADAVRADDVLAPPRPDHRELRSSNAVSRLFSVQRHSIVPSGALRRSEVFAPIMTSAMALSTGTATRRSGSRAACSPETIVTRSRVHAVEPAAAPGVHDLRPVEGRLTHARRSHSRSSSIMTSSLVSRPSGGRAPGPPDGRSLFRLSSGSTMIIDVLLREGDQPALARSLAWRSVAAAMASPWRLSSSLHRERAYSAAFASRSVLPWNFGLT